MRCSSVVPRYRLWPARRSSCRWPRPIRSCWSGSPGWRCAGRRKRSPPLSLRRLV